MPRTKTCNSLHCVTIVFEKCKFTRFVNYLPLPSTYLFLTIISRCDFISQFFRILAPLRVGYGRGTFRIQGKNEEKKQIQ